MTAHVDAQHGGCSQIRVLGDEGGKEAVEAQSETDDVFLKKIEATMLTQVCTQLSMRKLGHGFL